MDLSKLIDDMVKDKVIIKSGKGKKSYTLAFDPIIQFAEIEEIDLNIYNNIDHKANLFIYAQQSNTKTYTPYKNSNI